MKQSISYDKIFTLLFREAKNGNCFIRKYAAAVIKDSQILSVGHARTVSGINCTNCKRFQMIEIYGKISEFFDFCPVIHAETCAIINIKNRDDLLGSDLYLMGIYGEDNAIYNDAYPCDNCLKLIKYVGIKRVFIVQSDQRIKCYEV